MPAHSASQRVVAAVVQRGDLFLVCRRPKDKRHGGLWEFPGGKVLAGESDEAALRRELREELAVEAIEISVAHFEHADPDSPFVIAFVPVTVQGNPVCIEHAEVAWATIAELRQWSFAPSDARYVELLGSRAASRDVA